MGVETMWAVSTGHVSESTAKALDALTAKGRSVDLPMPLVIYPHGEYGWLINVVGLGGESASWVVDNHPSLGAVIVAAHKLGACWVLLDRDADVVRHLPVYDW